MWLGLLGKGHLVDLLGHQLSLHGEWLGIGLEALSSVSLERLWLSSEVDWAWHEVLVWVEASEGGEVSQVGDWNHWSHLGLERVDADWSEALGLSHHVWGAHHTWGSGLILVVVLVLRVLVSLVGLVLLKLLWHWWESHALWEVWEWVNELSLLTIIMEEGAAITKLALTGLGPVLAWLCLVVGVDGTEGSLTEVLWQRIVRLSQLFWSMGELTELLERADGGLKVVLAHLGLVLLSQSVELGLVSIEVVVVRLLGELSHHFAWWVVKVSWLTVGADTLTLISGLLTAATR